MPVRALLVLFSVAVTSSVLPLPLATVSVLEADERHVSVVVLSDNEIRVVIRFRVAGESRVGMVRLVEGHGHPCLQKTDGERRPLQAVHRVAWLCPATPPYRAKDKGVAARDAEHVWAEAP